MSSSGLRIQNPPPEYSQDKERERNRRIEELLRFKQDNYSQSQVFSGVPYGVLAGDDPAFVAPGSNVIVTLPFNTVLKSLNRVLDGSDLKPDFTVSLQVFMSLYHISGAGGEVELTMYLYRDGVQEVARKHSVTLNNDEYYAHTLLVGNIPPGEIVDFRMSHNKSQDFLLDMVKSRLWFTQLSPDPNIVDDSRQLMPLSEQQQSNIPLQPIAKSFFAA